MSSTKPFVRPTRVLIVTATVGAGHNAVARAIAAQLQAVGPDILVECLDALAFTPSLFRAVYAGGFALGMTRLPTAYGLGYRLTNRPNTPSRGLMERNRLWLERLALKRLAQRLLADPPDLIVQVHFLSAPLVGRLLRTGKLDSRQFVVVTDDEVHRFWYAENVDHWFVPAECSAEALKRWEIAPQCITISGIPVHPKWTGPLDRQKVLSEWGLPTDRKIVLLSGGTEFTCGPVVRIARRIVAQSPEAYVVVLAGRNKKLLEKVSALPEATRRLIAVGFTDRIHELVEVCSLMVTKPGGVTTAECLAKGTPMVLLKPVPGQEAGNAAYFQREGAAVIAANAKDIARTVARLLSNERELARLAQNARRLYRPAAATVAEAICQALQRA